ncbi:MAG: HEAT repeat domain-containing protein, partial [Treponema sp.]|nr:HEAT repeat domain-containing protein [Treponema sp.]
MRKTREKKIRAMPFRLAPLLWALLFLPPAFAGEEEVSALSAADQHRRDTLLFGTETEIANLIQTLRSENDFSFDSELINAAENTRNRNILTGVFNFFGEAERSGLEDRAIRAVRERDYETNETVLAAVNYLGWVNAPQAIPALKELITSRESQFLNNAIRALGRAAKGQQESGEAHETALFLLYFFNNRSPSGENQREIIVALGETESNASVPFLVDMIRDEGERVVLRMAALEAISQIGDPEGMDAVVEAVSSADPSVRSAAVSALGPFSGEAVERAILDGFRDSYFRTRQGAAHAAGQRQQASAVPFLRFRAENDDVLAVRDEAIRALGAINNSEAMAILGSLFSQRANSDRVRVLAADMLLRNDADTYAARVVAEMDDAQSRRQTALYNGFIRILTTAKSGSLESLARRFITAGG